MQKKCSQKKILQNDNLPDLMLKGLGAHNNEIPLAVLSV